MILMIDNYDSFTFNLVQYLGELGLEVRVLRNDRFTLRELEDMAPTGLVISPGPCTPNEAGLSVEVARHFAGRLPVLGVCLGHQCLAQAFGGRIRRANRVMHGKLSAIHHLGQGLFAGIDSPLQATRYHSLVIDRDSLPDCLAVTAWTQGEDGEPDEIMAIRHREWDLCGVQFHPESITTQHGHQLLANFFGVKNPVTRQARELPRELPI